MIGSVNICCTASQTTVSHPYPHAPVHVNVDVVTLVKGLLRVDQLEVEVS